MRKGFECVAYGPALFFMGGELDIAARGVAERGLLEAAEAGGVITIDMSNVGFMDSTGLSLLVRLLSTMPSGCVILHGVSPQVQRVLEVSGLDHHERLHIEPCGEDPFPTGRRLPTDREMPDEIFQRLAAMKVAHQELRARVEATSERTGTVIAAAATARAHSRELRRDRRMMPRAA